MYRSYLSAKFPAPRYYVRSQHNIGHRQFPVVQIFSFVTHTVFSSSKDFSCSFDNHGFFLRIILRQFEHSKTISSTVVTSSRSNCEIGLIW